MCKLCNIYTKCLSHLAMVCALSSDLDRYWPHPCALKTYIHRQVCQIFYATGWTWSDCEVCNSNLLHAWVCNKNLKYSQVTGFVWSERPKVTWSAIMLRSAGKDIIPQSKQMIQNVTNQKEQIHWFIMVSTHSHRMMITIYNIISHTHLFQPQHGVVWVQEQDWAEMAAASRS